MVPLRVTFRFRDKLKARFMVWALVSVTFMVRVRTRQGLGQGYD